MTAARLALRGDLLDFRAAPAWGELAPAGLRWRPDHWLLIAAGRIVGAQPAAQPLDGAWERVEHRGRLILPGFVDSHVHSAQVDAIASYGTGLLDWLDTHTFPAEMRQADEAVSRAGAARFLDALLAHGTTSACVFPTVHAQSVDGLFEAASARGMRLVAGKVLMDRNAPPALCDDVDGAEHDSEALIERWHGRGRLAYAVTVRFAPTSTPAQLAMAGRLCARHAGVFMQTHLAENRAEVDWVRALFPEARSYLDVYARAGLLSDRSVFAHGIWLDDADRCALADAGALLAHCPSSNLFLGSGLFDWRAADDAGIAAGLGSDVGGGTSLSMIRTMADAYKIQALVAGEHSQRSGHDGGRLTAWFALHAATRGAAHALGLGDEIGSLEAGTVADVCVWDWAVGPVATQRMAMAQALHERLFAWMTLADERNLVETRVAGRIVHARDH